MTRHERRPHKDYAQPLPRQHGEELRRRLRAYEDCPGITGDLMALIEDIDRRRAEVSA